eukprot:UN01723
MDVSPLCDREVTNISSSEVAFIQFVVLPWYKEWHELIGELIDPCMTHLKANLSKYIRQVNITNVNPPRNVYRVILLQHIQQLRLHDFQLSQEHE